jgi:general L-amino acid transport system substrate-binding protein
MWFNFIRLCSAGSWRIVRSCVIMGVGVCGLASPAIADTLDVVKKRGKVDCGVHPGTVGFSTADEKKHWSGFDVDYCRALAAAVLDSAENVNFVPLNAKSRFTALQSGEVDLLSRRSTWTMTRDTGLGISFTATNFFDGQGFMVRKSLGVQSAEDLGGSSVCTTTGTTTELNLADFFRTLGKSYEIVSFEQVDEVLQAFDNRRCDVYTSDLSGLYANRLKMSNPDEHIVLPNVISKEPLALAVRQGDDRWFNIVKWVHYALVNAEELGVNSSNVDTMLESGSPEINRLLGVEGAFGTALGLDEKWAYRAIKQVGNYEEIYRRNLGSDSRVKIHRGINRLWKDGGLMYAPPIR